MRRIALGLLASLSIVGAPLISAATDTPPQSGTNAQDRAPSRQAPLQPSASQADAKITDAVRVALLQDKRLSSDAQSVNIATDNGVVTLRGAVNSAEEKMIVASKPKGVPGVSKVNDQLEVTRRPAR